jgi:hypothetical protein
MKDKIKTVRGISIEIKGFKNRALGAWQLLFRGYVRFSSDVNVTQLIKDLKKL